MKLLIVTQVVDRDHPILGFFHRWIEEFSKHCEKIHVICLQEGSHDLPDNVSVHSLGKEKGKGRLGYLLTFYRLIFSLRKEYDSVFVHMNQIYVILGAPLWRMFGKKVGLWYAHGAVPFSLRIAERMTNIIFTSTKEGFRIKTDKVKIVGQGIDTKVFVPGEKSPSGDLRLITVGRISPSKNIDTLLRACALLQEKAIEFHFKIVGIATTGDEQAYFQSMKELTAELSLSHKVEWTGAVSNRELPLILQQSDIFIHDGSTNSLDKALLEGALCGCIVASSNPAYKNLTKTVAPELLFKPKDHIALATIIQERDRPNIVVNVRNMISSQYDISTLAKNIISGYQ